MTRLRFLGGQRVRPRRYDPLDCLDAAGLEPRYPGWVPPHPIPTPKEEPPDAAHLQNEGG